MDLVVSDASTLIHLASIRRFALLKRFFGLILIPPAVWREVVELGGGRFGADEVRRARQKEWISVVFPTDTGLLRLL